MEKLQATDRTQVVVLSQNMVLRPNKRDRNTSCDERRLRPWTVPWRTTSRMEQARPQPDPVASSEGDRTSNSVEWPSEQLHGMICPDGVWQSCGRSSKASSAIPFFGWICRARREGHKAVLESDRTSSLPDRREASSPADKLRRLMRLHRYERDILTISLHHQLPGRR